MTGPDLKALIEAVSNVVIAHADELTDLDQAIGDGDHGVNMKRGFEAVVSDLDQITAKPVGEALKAAGMQLVMKVGGASGPLYGTLFMGLGKAWPETLDQTSLATAFGEAIDAVKARGKSEAGQKTMLDVLIPVQVALAAGGDLDTICDTAETAAAATIPMQATKGRASFLGERSVGHMDPGARSSQLIINAVCEALS